MYSGNAALSGLKSITLLAILILYASGCGEDASFTEGNSTIPLKVEFCLAPGAPSQVNLTRMELTVSGPDIDEPLLFPITDINRETHTARGSITVPVGGNINLFVKAFEGDCPSLSGLLENVEVNPDRTGTVTITLAPMQIIIGLRSEQDQLNLGGSYVLELYIEDAPKLFSFTCQLGFDEAMLQPVEIVPGDFFGATDYLFMEDSQLSRNQQNRLSLGITRVGDDAGVCGSGTLFRLTFTAIGAGNAAISLLRDDLLTLTTPEPASQQIEDARISIGAGAVIRID